MWSKATQVRAKARSSERTHFTPVANLLAALGRNFYARGWMLGTSGNLSAVLSEDPLRLAITASGVDKGSLSPSHILEIDGEARVAGGMKGRARHNGASKPAAGLYRPSDEARLHVAVVRSRKAGAVLHTHS